jgi:flagellar biosynthesis protein FlhG
MLDQADDLRRLATHYGCPVAPCATQRPTVLAVAGGKGGVGTTTIAMRLTELLTQAGRRALLVDADPRGGNAAMLCRIEERYSLADVLAGRRNWAEAIETGPSGIRLVAGARWSEDLGHGSPAAAERLIGLLSDSGSQTDVAVIDVGNSPGRAVRSICRTADAVVMVTTTDTAAVVGTFAAIRALLQSARNQSGIAAGTSTSPFYLLVNTAKSADEAKVVHGQIARACRRLLGIKIIEGEWSKLAKLGSLREVCGKI